MVNPPSPTFSRSSTLVMIKSQTYVFKRIPSRLAVALLSPALLLTSLAMVVASSLLANRLEKHMTTLQRLAIAFQIFNHLFVLAAAVIGIHTALRLSHRTSRIFNGMLIGHIPFGVASGILCIYIVFKVTHKALATSLASAATAGAGAANTTDAAVATIASATATSALSAASSTGTAIATALAAAATSMASGAPAATELAAAAPTAGAAAGAAEAAPTPAAALAVADPTLAEGAPAPAAEAPAAGADQATLSARAVAPHTDGANGQCPTLAGTGLVWMCKKTSLMKGLLVLAYLALWFLEILSIYAGIRFNKQLSEARKIKGEDEDDVYLRA